MSENNDLELLRRRRILQMKKKMLSRKIEQEKKMNEKTLKIGENIEETLKKILKGRACEELEKARIQFPKETTRLEKELIRLSSLGEIKNGINGEQLLGIFRALGLNIRMDIKIRVFEDGKLKTISDKIRNK